MPSPPVLSPHRLARLIAWLVALVAWCASGAAHRRRAAPPVAKLRRAVEHLILILAARHVPHRARRIRHHAPRRRYVRLRAIGGAWLRKRLRKRGSFMAQAAHLFAMLAKRDTLARQLANRRRKPFSRLAPILARPGKAAALRAMPAQPALANTS